MNPHDEAEREAAVDKERHEMEVFNAGYRLKRGSADHNDLCLLVREVIDKLDRHTKACEERREIDAGVAQYRRGMG